jgi:septal ring factor EnvC (AmiA/AmiB activator)
VTPATVAAIGTILTAVGGIAGVFVGRRKIAAEADLTAVEAAEKVNSLLTGHMEMMIGRVNDAEERAAELQRQLAGARSEIMALTKQLRAAEKEITRMSEVIEKMAARLANIPN